MVEWSIFNEIFAVAFNVLYFVIIIGTIFIVILDNRNPVKTMAWVLVLFFLPIVGLVFYFFFGRSTRKEKLISKKGFTRLIKRPMAEYQAQKAFKPVKSVRIVSTCDDNGTPYVTIQPPQIKPVL